MGAYRTALEALSPDAYWRLDETSGTTATDSVGSFNGTYSGSYTQGVTSPNGEGTCVETVHSSEGGVQLPTGLEPGTNEWCYVASVRWNGGNSGFGLRYVDAAVVGPQVIMSRNGTNVGHITARHNTSTAETVDTIGSSYNDDVWRHLVCQRRTDGVQWYLEIYINGTLENSKVLPASPLNMVNANTDRALFYASAVSNFTLEGALDEVAYFKSKALSSTQISDLFDDWAPPIPLDYSVGSGMSITQAATSTPGGELSLGMNTGQSSSNQSNFQASSNLNLSTQVSSIGGGIADVALSIALTSSIASSGQKSFNTDLTLSSSISEQSLVSVSKEAALVLGMSGSVVSDTGFRILFESLSLSLASNTSQFGNSNRNASLDLNNATSTSQLGPVAFNPTLDLGNTTSHNQSVNVDYQDLLELSLNSSVDQVGSSNRNADLSLGSTSTESSSVQVDFAPDLVLASKASESPLGSIPYSVDLDLNTGISINQLVDKVVGVSLRFQNRVVAVESSKVIGFILKN